jgi:hypothetical protein
VHSTEYLEVTRSIKCHSNLELSRASLSNNPSVERVLLETEHKIPWLPLLCSEDGFISQLVITQTHCARNERAIIAAITLHDESTIVKDVRYSSSAHVEDALCSW